ncbi:MAG TPA: sigma factor [Candidatus Limnocylindrales bacterium]|nr:sigma factor [Candidatus Limnocylindrales bacterium]
MDTSLVIRAQQGDEEAFASLAVACGDGLHAVAHRILRDIDLAEDATQQALLAIWRDLPQLRDPARFKAWSYRLLVRACYAEGRRTRRWTPTLRLLPTDKSAAWCPDGAAPGARRPLRRHQPLPRRRPRPPRRRPSRAPFRRRDR